MSTTTALAALPAIEVAFPVGLPGFPGVDRFQLTAVGWPEVPRPFGRLVAAQPVRFSDGRAVGGIGVTVGAIGALWPALAVDIDDNAEAILELDDADDALLLAVVTLRQPLEQSTANLFAPVVINRRRALGLQFVPNASEATVERYIHTPLPLAVS